jgi:hypothetical protein
VLALDGARRPPAPSRAASRRAPNVPGTPAAASRGTRPSPPPRPTSRSTS